jgi:hypothetical protein
LVASCDGVSQVAKLVRPSGDVHGSIKVRLNGSELISNFRPLGATVWGNDVASTKKVEDDVQDAFYRDNFYGREEGTATQDGALCSARPTKSRMLREDVGDRPALKHAKTTPPQEMHFIAPQDCTPGNPVCLHGPHGDPIMVPMPEGAEPGKPCSIYLGPKSVFSVVVPEGAFPGSVVLFTMEDDGEMLTTVVPPGKMPGDSFDIVPPVVLIQVPHGCKGGDEVVYTTPAGTPAVVQVPLGFAAGHYFSTLLPVDKHLAEVAMKNNGACQPRLARTIEQVVSDARSSKDEGSSPKDHCLEGSSPKDSSGAAAGVAPLVDVDVPATAVTGSDLAACLASEGEKKVVVAGELDVMADFPDDELAPMPEEARPDDELAPDVPDDELAPSCPSAKVVRPSSPTSSTPSLEGDDETEALVAKATTPLLADSDMCKQDSWEYTM